MAGVSSAVIRTPMGRARIYRGAGSPASEIAMDPRSLQDSFNSSSNTSSGVYLSSNPQVYLITKYFLSLPFFSFSKVENPRNLFVLLGEMTCEYKH